MMKMNRVLKTNIAMLIGLAVNVGLCICPFAVLYVLLIVLYRNIAFILLFVLAVFGAIAFAEIKAEIEPGTAVLLLGGVGAVIAVNTVNRDYDGKEKVYRYFSMLIWIFAVYPGVIYWLLRCTSICWVPSV